jgi:hypothetical protein
MQTWLEIVGIAIVACVVWGTIPMLLLYWRRQRDRERERERTTVAALQDRIERLEAAAGHRDQAT